MIESEEIEKKNYDDYYFLPTTMMCLPIIFIESDNWIKSKPHHCESPRKNICKQYFRHLCKEIITNNVHSGWLLLINLPLFPCISITQLHLKTSEQAGEAGLRWWWWWYDVHLAALHMWWEQCALKKLPCIQSLIFREKDRLFLVLQ